MRHANALLLPCEYLIAQAQSMKLSVCQESLWRSLLHLLRPELHYTLSCVTDMFLLQMPEPA